MENGEQEQAKTEGVVREGYTARRVDGAIICLFCGEITLPPLYNCKCSGSGGGEAAVASPDAGEGAESVE